MPAAARAPELYARLRAARARDMAGLGFRQIILRSMAGVLPPEAANAEAGDLEALRQTRAACTPQGFALGPSSSVGSMLKHIEKKRGVVSLRVGLLERLRQTKPSTKATLAELPSGRSQRAHVMATDGRREPHGVVAAEAGGVLADLAMGADVLGWRDSSPRVLDVEGVALMASDAMGAHS